MVMQAVTDDGRSTAPSPSPHHRRQQHRQHKMPYLVGKGVLRPIPVASTSNGPTPCRCHQDMLIQRAAGLEPGTVPFNSRSTPTRTARSWPPGDRILTFVRRSTTPIPWASGLTWWAAATGHDWKDLLDPNTRQDALSTMLQSAWSTSPWPRGARALQVRQQGQHDQDEIDKTIKIMIELKKGGHFGSFWTPSISR